MTTAQLHHTIELHNVHERRLLESLITLDDLALYKTCTDLQTLHTSEVQYYMMQKLRQITEIWPKQIQILFPRLSSLRITSHLPAQRIQNKNTEGLRKVSCRMV